MADGQLQDGSKPREGLSLVALKALSHIRQTIVHPNAPRPPLETYVIQMTDAALHHDENQIRQLVQKMQKALLTNTQIAEVYVPIVARRLGDDWLNDRIGFAEVTKGSARLQGLLKHLCQGWYQNLDEVSLNRPAYLVAIPEGHQHTLGGSVLAGALRHRGNSVNLCFDLTVTGLALELRSQSYRGVLISASQLEHLENIRQMVNEVRRIGRETPVIVGGCILEQSLDILSITQADLVTSDVNEAIEFCDQFAEDTAVFAHHGQAR